MPARSRRRIGALVSATAMTAGAAATLLLNPPGAWASDTVNLTGHGYGHGRGMSQYGAYGYATIYGWDYRQILAHYYGGTHLATAAGRSIRVELSDLAGQALLVTSSRPMTVGGVKIAANQAARISVSGSSFRVAAAASCTATPGPAKTILTTSSATGSAATIATVGTGSSVGSLLTSCTTNRAYRGTLSLVNAGGSLHVVNTLGLDDYLRAVVPRESPASWGDAAGGKGINALRSQAVAARTYALNQHRYSYADICDNQNCQMYGGAGLDGSDIEDSRSNQAIADTAGQVLEDSAGNLVSAEYSSSSGGYTAGGAFPAVPDLGDVASPNHNWTTSVPTSEIESAFGVGRLTSIKVTGRNGLGADGGRVTSIVVTGSANSVTLTGNEFSETLGLKSNWFSVVAPKTPPQFFGTNLSTPGTPGGVVSFGRAGDVPLACDTNGDGKDAAVVYRAGTFYARSSMGRGAYELILKFGQAGDLPVCGDWNGDGRDSFGVYRPSNQMFYLTNAAPGAPPAKPAPINYSFQMGVPGDVPIAGDWLGQGRDTVGVYRPSTSTFYLLRTNGANQVAMNYPFGVAGDLPTVGDWNGDGKDTIGVFSAGTWELTNQLGASGTITWHFGRAGDLPMPGDWNGDKRTTAGLARGFGGI